jgi:LSD1 subclass zinc finger protein
MSGVVCESCGAPLTLPRDLTALDAPCAYCHAQTPLPVHLVELRLREHAQLAARQRADPPELAPHEQLTRQARVDGAPAKGGSAALWIVLLPTLFSLLVSGIVVACVVAAASQSVHHTATPSSHPPRRR